MIVQNKIDTLSIVIPSKNDEKILIKNITAVSNFCKNFINEFEILVVINGSTKNSVKEFVNFIEQKGLANIIIKYSDEVGKGAAVKLGLNESKYENVLITDADFSVTIDHLLKFTDEENNFLSPFIVGSRKSISSQVINTPFIRKITGAVYTFLVKNLLSIKVDDTQCGFKYINKTEFKNFNQYKNAGFSYDVELFLLAKKIQIKVLEVPVIYVHEKKSNVKVVRDSIKMFSDLFKIYKNYMT